MADGGDKDPGLDFEEDDGEEDAPLEKRKKMFSKELNKWPFNCTFEFQLSGSQLPFMCSPVINLYDQEGMGTSIAVCKLRCMMYGFGDDQNPYTESVDMLEDLVVEYITEMTKKAMDVGRPGRISVEDIIFLIRKDAKKYSRVKELLLMSEELRKARKAFDEIKYATTK